MANLFSNSRTLMDGTAHPLHNMQRSYLQVHYSRRLSFGNGPRNVNKSSRDQDDISVGIKLSKLTPDSNVRTLNLDRFNIHQSLQSAGLL
ncbi:hypothetical protein TNCV_1775441 [Trichonephila clavipes]|nr:hypothetical protein TNCV_1775441 [Trichonephila clavipes]